MDESENLRDDSSKRHHQITTHSDKKGPSNDLKDENRSNGKVQMGGTRGSLFQLKLLMLFLFNGLLLKHVFKLGTEIAEAFKFDDLVFSIRKALEERDSFYIVQAKHTTNKTIRMADLMTNDDVNFGLAKYYFSYKDAKREKLFESGRIDYAIVFTNAPFDLGEKIGEKCELYRHLGCIGNIVDEVDLGVERDLSVCEICSEGKFYRFKADLVFPVLKKIVVEFHYKKLAGRLLQFLLGKKRVSHDDPVFKMYHLLLASEVVDVEKGFFREEFIDLDCGVEWECANGLQKFRIAMGNALEEEKTDFDKLSESCDVKFIFSNGFGKLIKTKVKEQKWLRGDIKLFDEDLVDRSKIGERNLNFLAIQLIESLLEGKILDKNDRIFKEYHTLLIRDVIDVNNMKFFDKFINLKHLNETDSKILKGLDKFKQIFTQILENKGLNIEKINKYIENGIMKLEMDTGFGKLENTTKQHWPGEDETYEEIKDFLRILIFAVGQPDENKLGKIIQSNLAKKYPLYDSDLMFNYFYGEMLNWMAGENFTVTRSTKPSQDRFISSQVASEFFSNTERKFNQLQLKGPVIDYDKYIENFNIQFDDSEMEKGVENFLDADIPLFYLITGNVRISSIKVYQTLSKFDKNNEKNSNLIGGFIFTRLTFINSSSFDFIIESFKSEFFNHLLIVEHDLIDNDISNLKLTKIFGILEKNKKKKIILITKLEKHNVRLPYICSYNIFNDTKIDFSHLNPISQKSFLMKKKIKFQDSPDHINLKSMIDDNFAKLINSEILLQLIENDKISVGRKTQSSLNIIEFYINRKLCHRVKIEKYNFSSEYDEDYFYRAICNEDIKFKNDENITVEAVNNKHPADEISVKNIMYRKEGNEVLVESSCLSSLTQESRTKFNKSFSNEIVLICAEAGMGKTTVLSHLTKKIKESNPSLWVFQINLSNISANLNLINSHFEKFASISKNMVMNLLFDSLQLSESFEKSMFEHFMQRGKVVLLFDGFDEISPLYQNTMVKIIETLKQETNIKQLFLSTRPYDFILKDLVAKFNVSVYTLEPFSRALQIDFFRKFWSNNVASFDENLFKVFIDELLNIFYTQTKDKSQSFLGIALHTMMLASTLRDEFIKFHSFSKQNMITNTKKSLLDIMNVSNLYEKFLKIKYFDIFCELKLGDDLTKLHNKNRSIKDYGEIFLKENRLLALSSIFNSADLLILLDDTERLKILKLKSKIETSGESTGLVNKLIDGEVHFVHKTFAEYFVADWFIDIFNRIEGESKYDTVIHFFLKNIVNNCLDSYKVTCFFFNSKLNKKIINKSKLTNMKCMIQTLCTKDSLGQVIAAGFLKLGTLLIENGAEISIYKLGTYSCTFLKIAETRATYEDYLEIFNGLQRNLENFNFVLLVTDILGDTAWSYAIFFQNQELINALWEIMDKKMKIVSLEFIALCHSPYCIFNNVENENIITYYTNLLKKNMSLLNRHNKIGSHHYTALYNIKDPKKFEIVIDIIFKYLDQSLLKKLFNSENLSDSNKIRIVDKIKYYLNHIKENDDQIDISQLKNPKDWRFENPSDKDFHSVDMNLVYRLIKSEKHFGLIFHWLVCYSESKLLVLKQYKDHIPSLFEELIFNKDKNGNTAFHCAAIHNSFNIEILFDMVEESSRNIDQIKNINGCTILHSAAVSPRGSSLLKYFLSTLKDDEISYISTKNNDGNTVIHYATQFGTYVGLQTLLDFIVELEFDSYKKLLFQQNNNGQTILHLSVMNKKNNLFSMLLNHFSKNLDLIEEMFHIQDINGERPLHYFINLSNGNFKTFYKIMCDKFDSQTIVKFLVNKDDSGSTILHYLFDKFEFDSIMYIFRNSNFDIDAINAVLRTKNNNGLIPMFLIEKWNEKLYSFIDYIFEIGIIDIFSDTCCESNTFFHTLCKYNKLSFVTYTLNLFGNNFEELKKLFSIRNTSGKTIIFCFMENFFEYNSQNEKLFKILVQFSQKSAFFLRDEILIKDENGYNLIHIATKFCDDNALKLFYEILQSLNLDMKNILKIKNKNGKTVCHIAAEKEKSDKILDFVMNFLSLNYEVEFIKEFLFMVDNDGYTPVHRSIKQGHVNNIKIFFNALQSVDENIESIFKDKLNNDQNILHLAAERSKDSDVLIFLINHMKTSNNNSLLKELFLHADENGHTPFHRAIYRGYHENIKIIFKDMISLNVNKRGIKFKRDVENRTIYDLARSRSDSNSILNFLKQNFSIVDCVVM